ncbi:MAG: hypothetical protein QW400_02880 [Candidatus Diapherotrites archaeon]
MSAFYAFSAAYLMMQGQQKEPYTELLVIVHPNWLNYANVFGLQKESAIALTKSCYAKGLQDAIDWQSYRKAMFAIYGRAIIEAAKNPKTIVAIFAVPMGMSDYRAIASSDRAKIKKSEFTDAMRLIRFAKAMLGKRLIVINSPALNELKKDCERFAQVIAGKKVPLSKDFVLRAGGEISTGCVQTVANNLKVLLNPKKAFVDKSICGDLLIKENLTKRKPFRRTAIPKVKERIRYQRAKYKK